MMNKAEKKVKEAEAIAEIYSFTLMRIEDERNKIEYNNNCLKDEEANLADYSIEWHKTDIETSENKIKAFERIAEILIKQM